MIIILITSLFLFKKNPTVSGCDSGFGQMLAKRLHDIGYTVFAGCLAPEREGALRLKQSTSSRLHVIELNVIDDFHVQRAHSYVSEHLDGLGISPLKLLCSFHRFFLLPRVSFCLLPGSSKLRFC